MAAVCALALAVVGALFVYLALRVEAGGRPFARSTDAGEFPTDYFRHHDPLVLGSGNARFVHPAAGSARQLGLPHHTGSRRHGVRICRPLLALPTRVATGLDRLGRMVSFKLAVAHGCGASGCVRLDGGAFGGVMLI